MTTQEVRNAFLRFQEKNGHATVPSSSLIPENDPTTLFTGSGMQPMLPFLLGESCPHGTRIADSQLCLRSQDIDEVGDNRHTTFFEMLGNWSLGDYFKKEQIQWVFSFLVDELQLPPEKIFVSVFRGRESIGIPKDTEAIELWQKLFAEKGIEAKVVEDAETHGSQGGRIFVYDEKENWWSRAGTPENMPIGEPGGPDSEIFWDFETNTDPMDHPASDTGRFLEIGNSVFMEYIKTENGFEKLPQKNVDFGAGLERLVAAKKGTPDVFLIDVFDAAREKIETLSDKKYADETHQKSMRIMLDHLRAAVFMIAAGAVPAAKDAGYFTRRMLRRAIRESRRLGIEHAVAADVAQCFIEAYAESYPTLTEKKENILQLIEKEETLFKKTLVAGEEELKAALKKSCQVDGRMAFDFYQTYGFPLELTEEVVAELGGEFVAPEGFQVAAKEHAEKSRTAAAGRFKGGLADTTEETVALHTAAHLFLEAARRVLGNSIEQRGANITAERMRFDFSFDRRLTDEEVQSIEDMVNNAIAESMPVTHREMPLKEARDMNATGVFDNKYDALPAIKVYFIGEEKSAFSKEICGGPHVENTSTLAGFGRFKIIKQENCSAGVRRVKAVLT